MSTAKGLLIAVAGLGLVGVLAAVASASSSSSSGGSSSVPPGWSPPANALRTTLPSTSLGVPISVAVWSADPGQPPGRYQLFWSTSDPKTFLALFWADGQPPALLAVGSTPQSITLQQMIPELVAASPAQGTA